MGLEPQLVGRHRPGGVLPQHRGERVHVVPLEGVDVAGHERALFLIHGPQRVARCEVRRRQCGPSPLERAVDRRDRGLEQLGHLGRLPPKDLAQDQYRPLAGRQVLERGDERQPDRLARLGHRGGVASHRQRPAVGDGLDPRDLGQGLTEQALVGHARRPQVHGPGPPSSPAQHVEAHVRGDPVEPGTERRPALEPLEALPRPEQRLLHGVLGLERRSQHPVRVGGQLDAMLLEHVREVLGPPRRRASAPLLDRHVSHDRQGEANR